VVFSDFLFIQNTALLLYVSLKTSLLMDALF